MIPSFRLQSQTIKGTLGWKNFYFFPNLFCSNGTFDQKYKFNLNGIYIIDSCKGADHEPCGFFDLLLKQFY